MEITANMVKELREMSGAGMMDCKSALQETGGDMEQAISYLREKGIAKSIKKESRIAAEGLANVYIEGNQAIIIEVNSETDFVSKNELFKEMIDTIGHIILIHKPANIDAAGDLPTDEGTIKDLIIAKAAKIGEKLSLRRFKVLEKNDNEVFGSYIHMGGKIAVLTKLIGANEDVAKDVAMQNAAMKPTYIFPNDVPADVIDHEKEILRNQAIEEGKSEEIAEKMLEGRIKKFYKENCLIEQIFIKDDSMSINDYLKKSASTLLEAIRYEVGEGMEKKVENFAEEVKKQIG